MQDRAVTASMENDILFRYIIDLLRDGRVAERPFNAALPDSLGLGAYKLKREKDSLWRISKRKDNAISRGRSWWIGRLLEKSGDICARNYE